jgi:hypothetical protein
MDRSSGDQVGDVNLIPSGSEIFWIFPVFKSVTLIPVLKDRTIWRLLLAGVMRIPAMRRIGWET